MKVKRLTSTYNNLLAATIVSGSLLSPFSAFAQDVGDNNPMPAATAVTTMQQPAANDQQPAIFKDQGFLERNGIPIDMDNPWALGGGLMGMIALWFLLRSITLKYKDVDFAPLFLLEELANDKTSRVQMKIVEKLPWMAAGAFATAAAAGLMWQQGSDITANGNVYIAVDGDWSMAPKWDHVYRPQIEELLKQASYNGSQVCLINLAGSKSSQSVHVSAPMSPEKAYALVQELEPLPWSADRAAGARALQNAACGTDVAGTSFWLSNGLESEGALDFAKSLNAMAPLTIYNETDRASLLMEPAVSDEKYNITVKRADIEEEVMQLSAYTQGYKMLGSVEVSFEKGQAENTVTFDPAEHHIKLDDVYSFSLDGQTSAGAKVIVNNDFKPRSVGIASTTYSPGAEAYLKEEFYLEKALTGSSNIHIAGLEELLDKEEASIILLPDTTVVIDASVRKKLEDWMHKGGTLVSFSGANMTAQPHKDDPLLPVDLNAGVVEFANSATGKENEKIAAIKDKSSLFSHVQQEDTVPVFRVANMDPKMPKDAHVEMRLGNGVPFVTSAQRGLGRTILVHAPAVPTWSDFPINDMFVDVLGRIVETSNSVENAKDYTIPSMDPISVMDGKGRMGNPDPIVQPLTQSILAEKRLGPEHPPGVYGTKLQNMSYNLSYSIENVAPMQPLPSAIQMKEYQLSGQENWLKDYMLTLSILCLGAGALFLELSGNKRNQNNKNKTAGKTAPHMSIDL